MKENKKELEIENNVLVEILNRLDYVKKMEDAIANKMVKQFKINGYRRKQRTFDHDRMKKTIAHVNTEINLELNAAKKSLDADISECEKGKFERLKFIREIKRKYREIQKDILERQELIQKWDEIKNEQVGEIRSTRREIEQLYRQCVQLININNITKTLKQLAIEFYDQYYTYYKYVMDVIKNYREEVNYDEFKKFMEANYHPTLDTDFAAFVEELNEANEAFNDLKTGILKEYKTGLHECLDLFSKFMNEENLCSNYKNELKESKELINKEILEQKSALIGLDQLNQFFKTYFPKHLYKNIDHDSLEGKFKIVRKGYEAINAVCKAAEKDKTIKKILVK